MNFNFLVKYEIQGGVYQPDALFSNTCKPNAADNRYALFAEKKLFNGAGRNTWRREKRSSVS